MSNHTATAGATPGAIAGPAEPMRAIAPGIVRAVPLSRADARRGRDDPGQAAVLVLTVAAVLMVAFVAAAASMGRTVLDRTRAQTAADAAALASLDGGIAAAERLAAVHGADVVLWSTGPGPFEVTVTVRIGDATASARASDAP